MAARLSKKGIVVLVLGVFFILLPALIFTVYMLSRPTTPVGPDDTEAANECGCVGCCCNGVRYMPDGSEGPMPWCGNIGGGGDRPCRCDGNNVVCEDTACPGQCRDGVCTGEVGGNCRCESGTANGGCGSGCTFDNPSVSTGNILWCSGGTATQQPLVPGHVCYTPCSDTCPSTPPASLCTDGYRPKQGSSGLTCNCANNENEYTVNFGQNCGACSNPVGCCGCCERIPTDDPPSNQCDHGHLDIPVAGTRYTAGSVVTIEGWAADDDGIDTSRIEVFVDGTKVGNATAENACPTKRQDLCPPNNSFPNPVAWTYNWTVPASTTERTYQISVRWYDNEGITGSNCQGSTNIIGTPQLVYTRARGRVYCQDTGGPIYPIPGARIQFYKDGITQTETLTTDSDGYFISAANTTQLSHGSFAVRLQSIPSGGVIQATGRNYSDMSGPVRNTEVCTRGTCSQCSSQYEMCSGFTEGTNYGFQFIYSDCSLPPEEDEYVCWDTGCTNGETCNDGTTCVNNRCVNTECPDKPDCNCSDWSITKVGDPVCYEGKDIYAEVSYVIRVTNNSNTSQILESVVDTLDSKVDPSWLKQGSIQPPYGQIQGSRISWLLAGSDEVNATFSAGESRQFSYAIRIPIDQFGVYENVVIATPAYGEPVTADEELDIVCDVIIPETGLFDSTLAKVGAGLLLISISGIYMMSDGFDNVAIKIFSPREKIKRNRERFEKRVV